MTERQSFRHREIPGPQPHSYAIIARPLGNKLRKDATAERQKADLKHQELEEDARKMKVNNLRDIWLAHSNKAVTANVVKQQVSNLLHARELSVDNRRNRLRAMLELEAQQYIRETGERQETVLERQARMREQAKELRQRREADRMAFVQEKMKEQWRNGCDELRTVLSQQQCRGLRSDWTDQMKIKEKQEQIKRKEEQMYADLWRQDNLAKVAREQEEELRKEAVKQDIMNTVAMQRQALEDKKQEERRLKEEEAQLLEEEIKLRKLEDQREMEEKRLRQAETRAFFDKSLEERIARQDKEEKEQLDADTKLLEQLLAESKLEAADMAQLKRERREEDKRYRDYLKQLKIDEAKKEQELDALCDTEIEKTWQTKLERQRKEKETRKKLLDEVIESRKQQLHLKKIENERLREEAKYDRERLIQAIEDSGREEEAQNRRRLIAIHEYGNDLQGQIVYNARQKRLAGEEDHRVWLAQLDAEREYRAKMNDALANPVPLQNTHPIRSSLANVQGHTRSHGLNM